MTFNNMAVCTCIYTAHVWSTITTSGNDISTSPNMEYLYPYMDMGMMSLTKSTSPNMEYLYPYMDMVSELTWTCIRVAAL